MRITNAAIIIIIHEQTIHVCTFINAPHDDGLLLVDAARHGEAKPSLAPGALGHGDGVLRKASSALENDTGDSQRWVKTFLVIIVIGLPPGVWFSDHT